MKSDPLDVTPTPDIPGAYIGVYKRMLNKSCIAYKRDKHRVWTVMLSDNGGQRVLVKWGVDSFTANMRKAPTPLNCNLKRYPLERAIATYLNPPWAIFEPAAYKVLVRLSKGQDPDAEDTLDELLDLTPSEVKPVRHRRTAAQREERRLKRRAKFAKMNPAELRAFRDKRNARRKLRRLNAKKARNANG